MNLLEKKHKPVSSEKRTLPHFTDWTQVSGYYNPVSLQSGLWTSKLQIPKVSAANAFINALDHMEANLYKEHVIPGMNTLLGKDHQRAIRVLKILRSGELESLTSKINAAIEEAKYMLKLEEGWDEDNAHPIASETFEAMSTFLKLYDHCISKPTLQLAVPEINPCSNGSIDLSWRTEKARMLINIRSENGIYLGYYYGDWYNNLNPIKGNVPVDKVFDYLASWMKFLV
jgi:hypothetical protein